MASKLDLMQNDLDNLIEKGYLLYKVLLLDTGFLSEEHNKKTDKKVKMPTFLVDYDNWYSEALVVVKQILPDRLNDFVRQYRDEKRKEINSSTYGVYDHLMGVNITLGSRVVADSKSAVQKMLNQLAILKAVKSKFESKLFDIQEILQSDIFDSELSAAKELTKKGFFRAGGAVAGVVLEKHLGHVCGVHDIKTKKNPTLADLYQLLKDNDVIDTPMWRNIQHLADLRNLCDHHKDREPTKEDVYELVEGVEKVIKKVW